MLHHNPLLQSSQNQVLRCLLDFWFLIPVACCPGLKVRALLWLSLVWWVFWLSCVILQPCWFVDVIISGLLGHCPFSADKYNSIIGVHSYSYDVARRDLAHIIQSDIFIHIHSEFCFGALSCADWNTSVHHFYLGGNSTS